jgi:peptidoglycan/LPS O-acetylase OafA/YrhL
MTMLTHTPGLVERVFFLRPFRNGTWLGVDLFMLISGWLLGRQLLRESAQGGIDPWRFYVRRWLRTLPPYYAMLAVLYCADGPQFGGHPPFRTVLKHLLFLQVYLPPNLYGVSWSLCVEEHFYLLLPLIVWGLGRRGSLTAVAFLVFGLETASIAGRWVAYTGADYVPEITHLRCHGLFVGFLFAWVNVHRSGLWAKVGPWALRLGFAGIVSSVLVMQSVPGVQSRWTYVWVPTFGTWTLAMMFVGCVHEACAWSRFRVRGLEYAGALTYAVYLTHTLIPRAWLGGHSAEAGVRGMVVRLTLVLVFSVALHETIERPALRLRDWLFRKWLAVPVPG